MLCTPVAAVSAETRAGTDSRSIARMAAALYLQGRVVEAAELYERIVSAAVALNPRVEDILCNVVRRVLKRRYDIELEKCDLLGLRRALREVVEARVSEESRGRNLTPAEASRLVERRVAEIICDVGFTVSRLLGLV